MNQFIAALFFMSFLGTIGATEKTAFKSWVNSVESVSVRSSVKGRQNYIVQNIDITDKTTVKDLSTTILELYDHAITLEIYLLKSSYCGLKKNYIALNNEDNTTLKTIISQHNSCDFRVNLAYNKHKLEHRRGILLAYYTKNLPPF